MYPYIKQVLLCSLCSVPAETLDRWQRKAVLSNPGLDLEVPVEIGVIFLAHFADEMLLRAVVLQGKPPPQLHLHLRAMAGRTSTLLSWLVYPSLAPIQEVCNSYHVLATKVSSSKLNRSTLRFDI